MMASSEDEAAARDVAGDERDDHGDDRDTFARHRDDDARGRDDAVDRRDERSWELTSGFDHRLRDVHEQLLDLLQRIASLDVLTERHCGGTPAQPPRSSPAGGMRPSTKGPSVTSSSARSVTASPTWSSSSATRSC